MPLDDRYSFRFNAPRAVASSLLLALCACSEVQEEIYRATCLAPVGDWNGDGVSDFAIGEYQRSRVLIASGADGEIIRQIDGRDDFGWSLCGLRDASGVVQKLAIGSPGAGKIRIIDSSEPGSSSSIDGESGCFGWALSACADLDGDGLEDLVVAVPEFEKPGDTSRSSGRILSSASGDLLVETDDPADQDLLGFSIASLRSTSADVAPDLLVGRGWVPSVFRFNGSDGSLIREWAAVGGGVPHSYPIVVFDGADEEQRIAIGNPDTKDGGTVIVFDREGAELSRVRGVYHGDRFGHSIAPMGDLDGDGEADLAIGAPGRIKGAGVPLKPVAYRDSDQEDASPGYLRVVSGASGETLWEFSRHQRGDWLGIAACTLSDVDADGTRDVAVSGQVEGSERNFVTVLSGQSGELIYEILLPE